MAWAKEGGILWDSEPFAALEQGETVQTVPPDPVTEADIQRVALFDKYQSKGLEIAIELEKLKAVARINAQKGTRFVIDPTYSDEVSYWNEVYKKMYPGGDTSNLHVEEIKYRLLTNVGALAFAGLVNGLAKKREQVRNLPKVRYAYMIEDVDKAILSIRHSAGFYWHQDAYRQLIDPSRNIRDVQFNSKYACTLFDNETILVYIVDYKPEPEWFEKDLV